MVAMLASAWRRRLGGKKKRCDFYLEKQGYDTKTPSVLNAQSRGKILVSRCPARTPGTEIASEELKGWVMEFNLVDLNSGEKQSFSNHLVDSCPEQVKIGLRADRADAEDPKEHRRSPWRVAPAKPTSRM